MIRGFISKKMENYTTEEQFKKEKIYLDLSKLSREELMTLPQILKKAGETLLYPIDFNDVKYWSTLHKPNYANYWTLGTPRSTPEKNELTYPEFIKLFDGGEGENNGWIKIKSEKDLPEQGGRYYITRFGKAETAVYLKNNRWLVDGNDYPKTTNIHCITHYQPIQKPEPPNY